MLRARPPMVVFASNSRTLAPPSAHVIAAVRPASPPPMTAMSVILGTLRPSWSCVQFQFMSLLKGPVDLLVELDARGAQPLHEQLERALRDAIRDGRLSAG